MNNPNICVHWTSSGSTNKGKVRAINEDSFLDRPTAGIWVVADGMGGHEAGEIASRMITESLNEFIPPDTLGKFIDTVEDTLLDVDRKLRDLATIEYGNRTIGSTVVVLIAFKNYIAYLWAGDSRAYLFREGKLKQLTVDHSEIQNLIDMGAISPEHANNHPASNIITRAVGAVHELHIDVGVEKTYDGDTFLLCTDGLYRDLNEEEMTNLLAKEDTETIGNELIELALTKQARDNITVVVGRAKQA